MTVFTMIIICVLQYYLWTTLPDHHGFLLPCSFCHLFFCCCTSFFSNTPWFSFVISPLTRRPSSIRPGQFGYGKVPFSLSLHRTNRQARHTVNGTDETLGLNMENIVAEEEQMGGDEKVINTGRAEEEKGELEISEALGTKEEPETTTDRPRPHVDPRSHTHTASGRNRVASRVPVSRSQSPFSHRPHFDWSSVTAPPPPVHSFSRSRSSPFASPLHRPSQEHRDRELHQGFTPRAPPAGNVYPFQHSHASHLGVESSRHGASQVYKCSGPEREYRRCFSQVRLHPNLLLRALK